VGAVIAVSDTPRPRSVVPTTLVTLATGASAIVASAVGLVGLPVASRPAVVGAAVRLSTCVADGDGPEVPPYEAMPAQFSKLEAKAATSGLATATNTVFVLVCIAGAYAVAQVPFDEGSGGGGLSMSASLAHVAATVPLSYIGPAVAEFSASWMTAAAAGTAGSSGLGYWWVSFLGGLGTVWAAWALMLWRARIVTVASPSADQRVHDASEEEGNRQYSTHRILGRRCCVRSLKLPVTQLHRGYGTPSSSNWAAACSSRPSAGSAWGACAWSSASPRPWWPWLSSVTYSPFNLPARGWTTGLGQPSPDCRH
jgi:hypothetical protein